MRRPLVDLTTINAVQSLFTGGVRDPWGQELAGNLADLIIYADHVRYALPVPKEVRGASDPFSEPSLLWQLSRRNPQDFSAEEYSTAEPILLREDYLGASFQMFASWARSNPHTIKQWSALHNEHWIRPIQGPRTQRPNGGVFLLDPLSNGHRLKALSELLDIPATDISYAFDIVLRGSLYGQLTGAGEQYLNHPIRSVFPLPTMQWDVEPISHPIAVSFRRDIARLAPHMTQDEYSILLHELRGQVHARGLHQVSPGSFDREVIREIAAAVSLPPRLKGLAKSLGVLAGVLGGFAALPALGPAPAALGTAVSISAAIWSGRLPRAAARWKWLRWAVEWDVEAQAEPRQH